MEDANFVIPVYPRLCAYLPSLDVQNWLKSVHWELLHKYTKQPFSAVDWRPSFLHGLTGERFSVHWLLCGCAIIVTCPCSLRALCRIKVDSFTIVITTISFQYILESWNGVTNPVVSSCCSISLCWFCDRRKLIHWLRTILLLQTKLLCPHLVCLHMIRWAQFN